MTEKTQLVPHAAHSNVPSLQSLIPSWQEFQGLVQMGDALVKTKFLPAHIVTGQQAAAIMLKGRELGIPPMEAFSSITVIKGKPTISSELMLALIYRNVPGSVVNFVEMTSTRCEVEASRPGGKPNRFSFTIEDAKRAALLSNDVWAKYPRDMLKARTISQMARSLFPDAIRGASYTPEELGLSVDESGDTVPPAPSAPVAQVLEHHHELSGALETTRSDSRPVEVSVARVAPKPLLAPVQANVAPKESKSDWVNEEGYPSLAQLRRLHTIATNSGWSESDVSQYLIEALGHTSSKQLSKSEYEKLCLTMPAMSLNQVLSQLDLNKVKQVGKGSQPGELPIEPGDRDGFLKTMVEEDIPF